MWEETLETGEGEKNRFWGGGNRLGARGLQDEDNIYKQEIFSQGDINKGEIFIGEGWECFQGGMI